MLFGGVYWLHITVGLVAQYKRISNLHKPILFDIDAIRRQCFVATLICIDLFQPQATAIYYAPKFVLPEVIFSEYALFDLLAEVPERIFHHEK